MEDINENNEGIEQTILNEDNQPATIPEPPQKADEVIPSSSKKVSKRVWIIAAVVVGLLALFAVIGALRDYSTAKKIETDESIMLTTQLAENERTDGRIIFTVPEVFTCDKINVPIEDGQLVTIHNLHNQETSDYGTIGSDYEMDWSQKAFDKYLSDWEDENASMLTPTIEDSGTTLINGRECIYRVTSYDLDVAGKAYWRFYLLHDKETIKMALLSFYDKNDDPSYIQTLLESIRFK